MGGVFGKSSRPVDDYVRRTRAAFRAVADPLRRNRRPPKGAMTKLRVSVELLMRRKRAELKRVAFDEANEQAAADEAAAAESEDGEDDGEETETDDGGE